MKKVWVLNTDIVLGGSVVTNDVEVYSNKEKAKQDFQNNVSKHIETSNKYGLEICTQETNVFESYYPHDINDYHIFVRMVEKNVID